MFGKCNNSSSTIVLLWLYIRKQTVVLGILHLEVGMMNYDNHSPELFNLIHATRFTYIYIAITLYTHSLVPKYCQVMTYKEL